MDDIPQDVLHSTYESAQRDTPPDFLRSVANDFTDRADRERALRKKAWQSRAKELDTVAGHLIGYAEQLAAFIANNPDGVTLVGDDPCGNASEHGDCTLPVGHDGAHSNQLADWEERVVAKLAKGKEEAPQLPGNTGRCASFRRADPDDAMICARERGHDGNHIGYAADGADPEPWPRTPSGHVCGDVVVLHDGTALNCQRPLGHDGDEHHDGAYRFWPRGVGTRREVRTCERCNMDTHMCPGCGEPIGHYAGDCGKDCTGDPAPAVITDAKITSISLGPDGITTHITAQTPDGPTKIAFTDPNPQVTVPPCGDLQPDIATALGTSCMLPKGHTGKHIGYTGARWDQIAATLGDIAEQQRAMMVIPEQRPESDPVPVPRLADVLTAEFKEEVSATVAGLTGDEPIGTTVNVGGIEFVKHSDNPFGAPDVAAAVAGGPAFVAGLTQGEQAQLSNPFVAALASTDAGPTVAPPGTAATAFLGNPFQAPAPPPAAFLPPHLVPGEPKAHQSHSSITTMEKCGLQYRLKYRDGIGDDTPAWWNVAGTAFHAIVQAIESNYAGGLALWSPDTAHMQQEREAAALWKEQFSILVDQTERESGKARSTWKAAKGGKEGEAFWREYGGDLARMYVAHRRKFLAEPEGWRLLSKPGGEGWAHEVEFNATVDGVLLKGFIDSAWISADGMTILIEDFKSGSSEGDPFQPKLYGAALRALGFIDGRRVITRFYEARKGAHSATMELTPADDAEVSYRANTAATMDRMGIFPPSPSGYNCSTCPVKSRCPIMATKS